MPWKKQRKDESTLQNFMYKIEKRWVYWETILCTYDASQIYEIAHDLLYLMEVEQIIQDFLTAAWSTCWDGQLEYMTKEYILAFSSNLGHLNHLAPPHRLARQLSLARGPMQT